MVPLLLLSSCALFTPTKKQSVQSALRAVCLNSNGQARVHFKQNRYLVSYESANRTDKGEWLVGFDLPQRGQELLRMSYREKPRRVSGPFFKRLYISARNEGESAQKKLQGVISLLSDLPLLLSQAQQGKLNCDGQSCQKTLDETPISLEVTGDGLHLKKKNIHFWATELTDNDEKNWYQKLEISHVLPGKSGPESKTSSLSLFVKTCR